MTQVTFLSCLVITAAFVVGVDFARGADGADVTDEQADNGNIDGAVACINVLNAKVVLLVGR